MQPGAELQMLFLVAKVRTKSKPPNKLKKKRVHTHKWRENGEISKKAARTSEKQNRNEQKPRLRTNKNTDSKPGANSELRV